MHKIIRAMIALYTPEHAYSATDESAFHATQSSNNSIKILKLYLDAICDPSHAQEWQEAIQEELQLLKANGI
jgi:hypothetical protein